MEMNFRVIMQLTAFLLAIGIIYNLLSSWDRKESATLVWITGIIMVLTFIVYQVVALFRAQRRRLPHRNRPVPRPHGGRPQRQQH